MDARGIIWKLRQKERLTDDEIAWFARGLASGAVTDAQAGAFAMAACLNGLTTPERVALTLSMRDSGDVMRWDLPGPVRRQALHGGLGRLHLAPPRADARLHGRLEPDDLGARPRPHRRHARQDGGDPRRRHRSPRGPLPRDGGRHRLRHRLGQRQPRPRRQAPLRHPRRDLDGGEHRPHHRLDPVEEARGRTRRPRPRRQDRLRRLHGDHEDARALARSLVDTANGAGCRTVALLTDMHQPLAPAVGNAVEVAECMEALTGGALDTPLVELTIDLCATLLLTCGAETDEAAARRNSATPSPPAPPPTASAAWSPHLADLPTSPTAGATICPKPLSSLTSPRGHPATSPPSTAAPWAWRSSAWAAAASRAATPSTPPWASRPSPASGRSVAKGDPLFRLHARDEASAEAARAAILAAITIGEAPAPRPLVHERIA